MFKIISGSWSPKTAYLVGTTLIASCNNQIDKIELTGNIESVTILTTERKKSVAKTVATAAVGAFFLGGIGLLAGGLCGGNSSQLVVDVVFKDGRTFCAIVDTSVYEKLIKAERG